jgi:hypothetical protein
MPFPHPFIHIYLPIMPVSFDQLTIVQSSSALSSSSRDAHRDSKHRKKIRGMPYIDEEREGAKLMLWHWWWWPKTFLLFRQGVSSRAIVKSRFWCFAKRRWINVSFDVETLWGHVEFWFCFVSYVCTVHSFDVVLAKPVDENEWW